MSFLPLISDKRINKKVRIIYFIVQRIGSLSILAGGLIRDSNGVLWKWICFGLLLKASLAPLHFWGPGLLINLGKIKAFIFLTWQKVLPLCLLFITTSKFFIKCLTILNLLIAARCRLGSKHLYVLLFFSRLMHVGLVLTRPSSVATQYFGLYCLCCAPVFIIRLLGIDLSLLILNLAGLPPLTGFFMKLMVLQSLSVDFGFMVLRLSLLLLFAYLRLFLFLPINKNINRSTILVISLGLLFY